MAALRPGDVVAGPGRASVGRLLVVAPPRVRRGQALGPGHLPREARQVLELLEQVKAVAPPPIARVADGAMTAMSRGVVVATARPEGREVEVVRH